MERGKVPIGRQVGGSMEQPTPCGHVIYYPVALVLRAQQGTSSVFVTQCVTCGTYWIATTEPDGPHFRMHGEGAPDFYETLPWPEAETVEGFVFKTPASVKDLKERIVEPGPDAN